MSNREKLRENYEDSVLALLMDEFAEREGQRYIAENERLRQDPAAAVPEDVERRALQFIDREFSRQSRKNTGGKLLRFLARIAIAALIAVLLFGAAFALSETVRNSTLNFLIQMDERIATWQFEEGDTNKSNMDFLDILIEWLPEGYERQPLIVSGPSDKVLDCTNEDGGLIRVSVHESEEFIYTLDLEEADDYNNITVQGCDGIIVLKDDTYGLYWPYKNSDLVVTIESATTDEDTLLHVAESIQLVD